MSSATGERQAYRYEAQTPSGESLRGTMEGHSAVEVRERLGSLQLRVMEVDTAPVEGGGLRKIALGPDDFLAFNRQLAHLAAAGLPVERGLRLIAEEMHSGRLADAARSVAEALERGTPLQNAFSQNESRFPRLYGRLMEAGVLAGNLPGMLFNLGHHLELVAKLRQALWRTLAYPTAVLIALALVMLFISQAVIPHFAAIFADFRTTLPILTQVVMKVGEVFPIILIVVASLVLLVVALILYLRLTGRSGIIADTLFIWVPVIGPVLRAGLLARWIDALRLGVEAGLDLPRAIDLASEATASPRLSQEGEQLKMAITSGQAPHLYAGRLIPATVPAAIDLASATGELSGTLASLARMYQQQAEQRLRVLPAILTPLTLFVIAGCVAITVGAMFLPLTRLIQSVSGGEGGG